MPVATRHAHRTTVAPTAALCTNCMEVTLAERAAALVSFQRMQPSIPRAQNNDSADVSREAASHFGG
jgi:hypothetical protein